MRLSEPPVTIAAKGEVVWTYDVWKAVSLARPGSGIHFTSVPVPHRRALDRYLTELAETERPPGSAS